jgi:hypothetical protein
LIESFTLLQVFLYRLTPEIAHRNGSPQVVFACPLTLTHLQPLRFLRALLLAFAFQPFLFLPSPLFSLVVLDEWPA